MMRVWPSLRVEAAVRDAQAQARDPICAYVYDLDALRAHARAVRAAMPAGATLFYAVKANAEPALLAALAGIVDGFEVASGGEIAWLRDHLGPVRLLFGGPGKTDGELRAALDAGVERIHVESIGELRRLAAVAGARTVPIALRVNPAIGDATATRLMMAGGASPFGIDEDQLDEAVALLRALPNLRLDGFHIHALSHQLDMRAHADLLALYLDRLATWRRRFALPPVDLNMGGGIGINYAEPDRQPDWAGLMRALSARLATDADAPRIRFELGRYLSAACGFYAAEVVDLKRSGGRLFAICRGGTHHFRTPAAQGHSHPVRILPASRADGGGAVAGAVTFVGQLCTPKDVLARDVPCERLWVGDVALFPLAGAYAWSISHHDFLKHPPPMRLLVDAARRDADVHVAA